MQRKGAPPAVATTGKDAAKPAVVASAPAEKAQPQPTGAR
jgi:hypothetical protein